MSPAKAKRRAYRLLDRGGNYFKTDLFYLTKGGFWLGIGRGVNIIFGLILAVGFANLLPPDVYGNYRFVLSLAGVAGAFTLTGMGTAITRAVAQGFEGALRTGFLVHLKWSIGIVIAAFIGSIYYYLNDNNALAVSLLIVGSFSPFLESARLYNAYLIGKKKFRRSVLLGIGRKAIPTAAMLTTLFLTDNPVLLVFVYFASNTVVMLSLYFSARRLFTASSKDSGGSIVYSKHLSLMNVAGRLSAHLDKILVFHFLGAAPLAIYAFATIIPSHMRSSIQIFKTLILPKFSNRSIKELKSSAPRKALTMFVVLLMLMLLYIIFAPLIFRLLFPQYLESILFSQVFALSILFTPLMFFGQTFVAHMKKRELYILKTIGPIVRILLFLLLLPLFGIWGIIAAILLTKTIVAILMIYFFRRL